MKVEIWSLLIFCFISILIFLTFRRPKGWYWVIRNDRKKEERIWKEDILKLLYHSSRNNQSVSLLALTGALKIRESRAIDLLNSMENEEFLRASSASIEILEKGKKYALKIIRVHRLWEKYLSEKTGFDKLEWHDRAEQMEHHLSDLETEELSISLGNPRFDPHGDPIPTKKGEVQTLKGIPLSNLSINQTGRISHIEDEPEIIYKQIISNELHIGSTLRVIGKSEQFVQFKSEGEEFKLNSLVASNITVQPLEENEIIDERISRLSNLKIGENAKIVGISRECRGEIRRRLLDLGFVKGSDISIDKNSPMGNPTAYLIKRTSIAIRKSRANQILIKIEDNGE